jgi:hypothetical protein
MNRRVVVVSGVILGVALIAAGAYGDKKSVDDRIGDTECPAGGCSGSQERSADIVNATAGHAGGRLQHTVTVVGRFQYADLAINTDSDPNCERRVIARRSLERFRVVTCSERQRRRHSTGLATVRFHRHSVEISFSKRAIGGPRRYGWAVYAASVTHPLASDSLPGGVTSSSYILHRLR